MSPIDTDVEPEIGSNTQTAARKRVILSMERQRGGRQDQFHDRPGRVVSGASDSRDPVGSRYREQGTGQLDAFLWRPRPEDQRAHAGGLSGLPRLPFDRPTHSA